MGKSISISSASDCFGQGGKTANLVLPFPDKYIYLQQTQSDRFFSRFAIRSLHGLRRENAERQDGENEKIEMS